MSCPRKRNLVGCAHVGNKKSLSEIQTIRFELHDFANLPKERGKMITSPSLTCLGCSWRLQVYPGGAAWSDKEQVNVSIYLERVATGCQGADALSPHLQISIHVGSYKTRTGQNLSFCMSSGNPWGWSDFLTRAEALTNNRVLSDGTLVVEVDLQTYSDKRPLWCPKENLKADMLRLLEGSDCADITFSVEGTKFRAHRCMLSLRAPNLYVLVEEEDDSTEVEITQMKSNVFHTLLQFIYTGELDLAPAPLSCNARELLEAADRFGCKKFKLHMEAKVVKLVLEGDNVADWILFAHAHSCALLKDEAIKLFVTNPKAVMGSPGWANIKESAELLAELMESMCFRRVPEDDNDIDNMDVSTLREKLERKGMDVDGTREMLIDRLKP